MALRERYGNWHYRFKIRGESYAGSTGLAATTRNQAAAAAIEAQKRLDVKKGIHAPTISGVQFPIAVEQFLDWCDTTEYRSKPSTALRIRGSFASIREFFQGYRVHEITESDIERYKTWRMAEQHVKDCTIRNDLFNFSIFFNRFARKEQWCTGNPVEEIKKPSNETANRMRILSRKEEEAYFSCIPGGSNLHDLGRLMILQGPRPEEILSLRRSSYNVKERQITLGHKTNASRRVLDLCDESVEILNRRLRATQGEWLFPSERRKGQHIKQLYTSHNQACLDSGVQFVIYDLRHTFATRMAVEIKVDLPTLAAILGHSTIRVVLKYIHPTAEHKKEAMQKYQRSLSKGPRAVPDTRKRRTA